MKDSIEPAYVQDVIRLHSGGILVQCVSVTSSISSECIQQYVQML